MKAFPVTLILLLSCSAPAVNVQAQNSGDSVQYVQGFPFKEGIYLTYEQFKANKPVPKRDIIFGDDSTRTDFIKQALTKDMVVWKDSITGNTVSAKVSSLWGYSENSSVYIRFNYAFNRIMVIGSICHFTSYVTDYMYTGPGTYPNQQYGTPVESLQQFVLDTKTGRILSYDVANMETLLASDSTLHAEFMSLKRRQKKDQLFIYLRKYNERHPLYFRK